MNHLHVVGDECLKMSLQKVSGDCHSEPPCVRLNPV